MSRNLFSRLSFTILVISILSMPAFAQVRDPQTNNAMVERLQSPLVSAERLEGQNRSPAQTSNDGLAVVAVESNYTGPGAEKLQTIAQGDEQERRLAAADLCILLLKENDSWSDAPTPFTYFEWAAATPESMRLTLTQFSKGDPIEVSDIANMCAHQMSRLKFRRWLNPCVKERSKLEDQIVDAIQRSDDPMVKTMLLIGLTSSPRKFARDAMVRATSDSNLGVRKSICYLISACTGRDFGPIGCIHIGSSEKSVNIACEAMRMEYESGTLVEAAGK